MLIMSATRDNGATDSMVCPTDSVPTARKAMLRGFREARGYRSMCLSLNNRIIASLYRDFSGAAVWR